jgi:hypothetical protein
MTLKEIQELAGHREVSPWVVKLVGDAVAKEREACAKVCEDGLNIATSLQALDDMEIWGEKFAKAIRARGNP